MKQFVQFFKDMLCIFGLHRIDVVWRQHPQYKYPLIVEECCNCNYKRMFQTNGKRKLREL